MNIFICSKNHIKKNIKKHDINRLISISNYGDRTYIHTPYRNLENKNILRLSFEDDLEDSFQSPKLEHINLIEDYYNTKLKEGNNNLLIHCEAGISRSSATALYILLLQGNDIYESIEKLKNIKDDVRPNLKMINFIDNNLSLNGELYYEVEKFNERFNNKFKF